MAPPQPPSPAPEPGPTLAALGALGAARLDPVRWAFASALASRAQAHQGEARQWLDARLARALADLAARCAQAGAGAVKLGPARRGQPGPLADLVRQLDRPALPAADAALAAGAAPGRSGELKALTQFRSTWARISVDRQLSRSLAQLPQNPGPLNSQLLALRALQLMQDIAPAYLQRFVTQVEALLWLDGASQPAPPTPARAVRRAGDKPRKAGAGRAGR